jgi:hypothetical protein
MAQFADDLTTLTVRGFIWDTLIGSFTISLGCIDDYRRTFIPEGFKYVCSKMLSILEENSGSPYDGDPKSALWRTLVSAPGGELCKAEAKWYEEDCPKEMEVGMVTDDIFNWSTPKIQDSFESLPSQDRTMVITECGYIGQAPSPKLVNEEDLVCVLLGCPVPIVLRAVEDHYELVGDIYLDGIMHGEAMRALAEGKVKLQDFELH